MKGLLAFLVVGSVFGAMAAGQIAEAIAAWSAAQVQIAQIDANVQMYQIGVDAVQRANDRSVMWFALGLLAAFAGPALVWLMRHNESEAAYLARQSQADRRHIDVAARPAPPPVQVAQVDRPVVPYVPNVPHVDNIAEVWIKLDAPRASGNRRDLFG